MASTGQGSCCTPRGGHTWGAKSGEAVPHARGGGRSTAAETGRTQFSLAQSSVADCARLAMSPVSSWEAAYGYGRRVEAGRAPEWTLALAPASFLHPAHLLQSDIRHCKQVEIKDKMHEHSICTKPAATAFSYALFLSLGTKPEKRSPHDDHKT